MRKLNISEPSRRESGPILICDEDHNDVAEFFHNEHATVPQSYETALAYARCLVLWATSLSKAVECLQSIADMKDDEPLQPDDADWRFRALEAKRAAQCTVAALSKPAPVDANASAEIGHLCEKLSYALAGGLPHKSSCAVYLAPAYEPQECDCGAKDASAEARLREALDDMLGAFAEGVCWSPEQRAAYEKAAKLVQPAGGNETEEQNAIIEARESCRHGRWDCPDCEKDRAGGDEAKKSEGGTEGRAVLQHARLADTSLSVSGSSEIEAGIESGPSDPPDRREPAPADDAAVAWRYRFVTSVYRDWSDWFIVDDHKSVPIRPLPDIEIMPLYTRPAKSVDVEAVRDVRWLVSSARAFLRHFNPCNLAEDKSQQWQSLSHQCDVVERALRRDGNASSETKPQERT